MNDTQIKAIEEIETQQRENGEYSTPWLAGEQLKEICAREPKSAAIILDDLANADMSIGNAEKKIREWADDKKKTAGGICVGVPPSIAEGILREFYGLPGGIYGGYNIGAMDGDATAVVSAGAGTSERQQGRLNLSLDDFLSVPLRGIIDECPPRL